MIDRLREDLKLHSLKIGYKQDDAEDAAQDAVVKIMEKADTINCFGNNEVFSTLLAFGKRVLLNAKMDKDRSCNARMVTPLEDELKSKGEIAGGSTLDDYSLSTQSPAMNDFKAWYRDNLTIREKAIVNARYKNLEADNKTIAAICKTSPAGVVRSLQVIRRKFIGRFGDDSRFAIPI